jgi:hypothetical protein
MWPLGKLWWREHTANGPGEWVRPSRAQTSLHMGKLSEAGVCSSVDLWLARASASCSPLDIPQANWTLPAVSPSVDIAQGRDLSSIPGITWTVHRGRTAFYRISSLASWSLCPRGTFERLSDCWWLGSIVQMSLKVSHWWPESYFVKMTDGLWATTPPCLFPGTSVLFTCQDQVFL